MQTYEQMKAHIDHVIAREREALFALNGWIFDKHELSCREYETSQRVVDFLRDKGYTVEYPFYGIDTAFFAAMPGRQPRGRKIAILTEYDALPDVGHACGHCLETVPHDVAIHQREFAAYMTTERAYHSLQTGAKIIAYHCARIFSDGELFRRMKEDFDR